MRGIYGKVKLLLGPESQGRHQGSALSLGFLSPGCAAFTPQAHENDGPWHCQASVLSTWKETVSPGGPRH